MKLESFSFRNIGPFGNRIVDIDLLEDGGLWLVFGKNGQGKSTFLNMTKALYYGKVDKLKKDDIANRFNKYGWIMGRVKSTEGVTYEIERKFSPSGISVRKGSVDLDIAGISNAQNFIDNEISMMPYQIYSNIVSLSVNDFKSFLTMTPKDKREIIDRIFSIEILNTMNTLVKNDMKNLKFDVDLMNREISTIHQSVLNYQAKLEEAKLKANNDNKESIRIITESINEAKPKYEFVISKYNELIAKQNDFAVACKTLAEQKNKITYDINVINSKIKLYENDKCPTCSSSLNSTEQLVIKEHLLKELDKLQESWSVLNITDQQYSEYGNKLTDAIRVVTQSLNEHKTSWENLHYKLNELNNVSNDNTEQFTAIISDELARITVAEQAKSEKADKLSCLSLLEGIYGSDGIKQDIIESYLPVLNEEIAITLSELHFPYSIEFDKEFEPILRHINIEISPDSLSTGERKRVDLAVLISIIRIMKRKYPHLNMFMLDEVLSSIDQDGITDIIKFLQSTSKELKINIFIVNHSPLPLEYFDRRIDINKKDNFSEMTVETLT